VRIASTDPLFHLVRDAGVPVFKDNKYKNVPDEECPTWVVEFPVASPRGAKLRQNESALEQLDRYLQVMNTWCNNRGHNQSATVYVKDNEWQEVGDWLFKNFNKVTGLSFLPYDGGKYSLAPYEEITEEEYTRRMVEFPEVDYSLLPLYENEDMGGGAKELACVGGACEIDFDKMSLAAPETVADTPPPAKWGDY
jgi:ribonucleoside-diphosphate reductase alpha chain